MTAAKMPDEPKRPDEIYVIGSTVTVNGTGKTILGMWSSDKPDDLFTKYTRTAIPTPSPVDCREAFEKYVTFGGVKTVSDAGSPLTIAIAEKIWQAAWNAAKGEGK